MNEIGTTTIATGKENLRQLIEKFPASDVDWNEAETRFQIIDHIIVNCLGWPKELLRLERSHQGREYSDYELGHPALRNLGGKTPESDFRITRGSPTRSR